MHESIYFHPVQAVGKKLLVLCNTPGTTATAAWVSHGFPLAATPTPLEADVLLSCLDFIHSSSASSRVRYIDIIN